MALEPRALHPLLGVEIVGVEAFEEHSVLLFREQTLDDEAQIAFSRRFGPLETTIRTVVLHARYRPEISNLANVDAEDRLIPRGLVGEGLLAPEDAAQVPSVPQALVRANPANGRKAFFVASHACEILGMPTDQARALIRELLGRATASRPPLEREPLPSDHASHDGGGRWADGRRGGGDHGGPGARERRRVVRAQLEAM
jgi:alpha-ketoglutarate-dependent taurine dioxygenase